MNSRDKGKRGEREVASLLREELGIEVTRNLVQSREGGCDLLIPKWAAEVKLYAEVTPALKKEWWEQTLEQAKRAAKYPVLFYRQNRRGWVAVCPLSVLCGIPGEDILWTAELSVPAWCAVYREKA